MKPSSSSKSARLMTRLVLLLSLLLIVWGILSYGLNTSVNPDFWHHISDRIGGPMTFRFVLQPTIALIAAVPAGFADAKGERHAFATIDRLREGLEATARTILLGLSMDLIYQIRVLRHFYPVESLLVALLLALVPYIVFRIIAEVAARAWFRRRPS